LRASSASGPRASAFRRDLEAVLHVAHGQVTEPAEVPEVLQDREDIDGGAAGLGRAQERVDHVAAVAAAIDAPGAATHADVHEGGDGAAGRRPVARNRFDDCIDDEFVRPLGVTLSSPWRKALPSKGAGRRPRAGKPLQRRPAAGTRAASAAASGVQGSGAGLARYCLDSVWYWPPSVDGVVWFSAPAPNTIPSPPTATTSDGCFRK